jgi:hypothetical protein
MKRVLILCAVLAAVAAQAAGGLQRAVVQGTGVQCFTAGGQAGHYLVQCPSIDGGTGQKVWYRPTQAADAGGVTDAGLGDLVMDFSSNTDPVPVDLAPGEARICFGTFTDYSALYCTVAAGR